MTNKWIALQKSLADIEDRTGYSELDRISQRLLEWIATAQPTSSPIYIQTIVQKSGVASPATIFKALTNLESRGLLLIEVDKTDLRRRIVTTTSKANKLLARLAAAL